MASIAAFQAEGVSSNLTARSLGDCGVTAARLVVTQLV